MRFSRGEQPTGGAPVDQATAHIDRFEAVLDQKFGPTASQEHTGRKSLLLISVQLNNH
ncbi:hypothetical protein [Nocardia salmonicida]|uniref:hypothetical protein n=1 Tax=Nocardia salmonicida TaxID=53431 RepID=UPI003F4D35B4